MALFKCLSNEERPLYRKRKPLPCYPSWLHSAILCRDHLREPLGRRNVGATDILLPLIPTSVSVSLISVWILKKNGEQRKDFGQSVTGVGTSICWLWVISIELPFGFLKISTFRHILKEIYIQAKINLFVYEHWIYFKISFLERIILLNIWNYQ